MADATGRLARIRDSLSPSEWARTGGMVGAIAGLHIAGWLMLAAAVSRLPDIAGLARAARRARYVHD